jgi:hypothetical protein
MITNKQHGRQDGFKLNFAGNTGAIAPIELGYPSSYFEPINWHRTVCHELGHNAVIRIMPRRYHRPRSCLMERRRYSA